MSAGTIGLSSLRIEAENQWLTEHGFVDPSVLESYSSILTFFKGCASRPPEEWRGKSLSFSKGEVTIEQKSGETPDKIALVMQRVLNLSPTREQKIDLAQAMAPIRAGLGVRLEEASISVILTEAIPGQESPASKEKKLPLFLVAQSPYLRDLLGSFSQSATEVPTLTLPTGITLHQFQTFLELFQAFPDLPSHQLDFDNMFSVLFLANFLMGAKACELFLDKWTVPEDLASQKEGLAFLFHERFEVFPISIRYKMIDKLFSAYVRLSLQQGDRMETICQKLSQMEGAELLKDIPLTINLAKTLLATEDLLLLAGLCPNVESLDVSRTNLTTMPGCWKNLKIFKAREASQLTDLSGLDGLIHLKEIYVDRTAITKAPTGCSALEKFTAWNAGQFTDLSGLDNLTKLKEVNLAKTAVKRAPTGCTALETFLAYDAEQLSDPSGLDGLIHLKEVYVDRTAVRRAPHGCTALEKFQAERASRLSDLSGLDGLTQLKKVDVTKTKVKRAPHGCTALEIFLAKDASLLSDLSGLDGLTQLKEIHVDNTAVTRAPTGCSSLEKFEAYVAAQLSDLSGLFDSQEISFHNSYLPIRWPRGSLSLFSIRRSLQDPFQNANTIASQFALLPASVRYPLEWGVWLYSGMPEGDPFFGKHLIESNPYAPSVRRSLESLAARGLPFFASQVQEDLMTFPTKIQEAENSDEKLAIFQSMDPEAQRIVKLSIWRACGMESSDPDFAGHFIQRNPNDPIIMQIAKKIQAQILSCKSKYLNFLRWILRPRQNFS